MATRIPASSATFPLPVLPSDFEGFGGHEMGDDESPRIPARIDSLYCSSASRWRSSFSICCFRSGVSSTELTLHQGTSVKQLSDQSFGTGTVQVPLRFRAVFAASAFLLSVHHSRAGRAVSGRSLNAPQAKRSATAGVKFPTRAK